MFNRKSNKIKKLQKELNNSNKEKIELINDFISILKNIQETNNTKMQWKHKQLVINNSVDLAVENYTNKIVDLDIAQQH